MIACNLDLRRVGGGSEIRCVTTHVAGFFCFCFFLFQNPPPSLHTVWILYRGSVLWDDIYQLPFIVYFDTYFFYILMEKELLSQRVLKEQPLDHRDSICIQNMIGKCLFNSV